MNTRLLLEKWAQLSPLKTAVIFRDRKISFSELKSSSFRLADSLKKLGIRKGDTVGIYLPSWPEYMFAYLAIWMAGATAVPLDFMLTEDELVSCLSHCEARMLIMKRKATISLDKLKNNIPTLRTIALCHEELEGFLSVEALIESGNEAAPIQAADEHDCAIVFYTSGTTGKPKGVLINYKQLGAPPQSMSFFVNGDLTAYDSVLCALPFSHLGGLIYIQNLITFGFTLVLMERFIPLEFLKNIQQHKIACFWIVPSMYYALLQLKEFEIFDLSSLRWIVTFGASNSPDALRRFHYYCPQAFLLNGWGMTETNAPTVVLPMGSNKIESVGRPAPWIEVKIFDDTDKEVAVSGVGEVVVRGWVVTEGYLKDEVLTRETKRNGWFHTGDLGTIDVEGFLYIVGRKKEMIKVGGEIVFEPEVEAVLYRHEAVAEAAVVGIPDKLRGEVPKAFIVLKEGAVLSEEDLRYFLRQHLAHFKIPHVFEFAGTLPKNRTGKIDKEKLRV